MASNSMRTRIVSSSQDNLAKLRLQLPASGDPHMAVNLGGLGKTLITQRTSAGIGAGGKPFTPYKAGPYTAPVDKRPPGYPKPSGGEPSKSGKTVKYGSYADYKAAIGRGATPQLSVSGQMLAAIQVGTLGPNHAFLFFSSREEAAKAHGHEFGTTTTQRSFFDLSDFASDVAMREEALRYMKAAAKKARLQIK